MQKLLNSELNRLDVEAFKSIQKAPIVIICDNLRSLSNVGSIFRTSDAFLIQEIVLCGITATPPHREIQKTALGSTETVNWSYYKTTSDAILHLQKRGGLVYAVEQALNSVMLNDFEFPMGKEIALVFGNEVHGVEEEVMKLVDGCIEIPQFGTKHSLNVSISAGILIWDIFMKWKKG